MPTTLPDTGNEKTTDATDNIDGIESSQEGRQRSRWIDYLILSTIVLIGFIGFVLFDRHDLKEQVVTLNSLLDAASQESDYTASALEEERAKVAQLQTTMGQINRLSTDLVENLQSLQQLTSGGLVAPLGIAAVSAGPPVDEETLPVAVNESPMPKKPNEKGLTTNSSTRPKDNLVNDLFMISEPELEDSVTSRTPVDDEKAEADLQTEAFDPTRGPIDPLLDSNAPLGSNGDEARKRFPALP